MFECEISAVEANYWWRRTTPAGALLNKLMFLFIVVPIGLVLKSLYSLSFVVFAFMVPYGFFLRFLLSGRYANISKSIRKSWRNLSRPASFHADLSCVKR